MVVAVHSLSICIVGSGCCSTVSYSCRRVLRFLNDFRINRRVTVAATVVIAVEAIVHWSHRRHLEIQLISMDHKLSLVSYPCLIQGYSRPCGPLLEETLLKLIQSQTLFPSFL